MNGIIDASREAPGRKEFARTVDTNWLRTTMERSSLYYVLTEHHQVDRHRPAGLAPLRGADILLKPQSPPDPSTHYEAWSHFVTTNHWVLTHVLGSILGLILAIFGTFALGAYLTTSRAGRLGLVAMIITVVGALLIVIGGAWIAWAVLGRPSA
jgi:hypothetical protein